VFSSASGSARPLCGPEEGRGIETRSGRGIEENNQQGHPSRQENHGQESHGGEEDCKEANRPQARPRKEAKLANGADGADT